MSRQHTSHRGWCSADEDVVEPLVGHERGGEAVVARSESARGLAQLFERVIPALAAPRAR